MRKLFAKTNQVWGVVILSGLIVLAFILSGFTIATMKPAPVLSRLGEEPQPVNVLKNGGFEEWTDQEMHEGVALNWAGFNNGQAAFGYYNDMWPEVVLNGKHAQLLEINMVEPNVLDRVVGVQQTAAVNPNSDYKLTIYAIMRSQAPAADRNKNEFEMHWGIDFSGEGNYKNVQEWHYMPVKEQYRLGSTGKYPEDIPLKYEIITGTVATGSSNKMTLFIRGLKKFSTGTEVNFDIDNVSLVGMAPAAAQPAPTATKVITGTPSAPMPTSGAILPNAVSVGAVVLGVLVVMGLGVGAAAGLRHKREEG